MPNKTLLSAEQASEQLRNIIEKFFSWSLQTEGGKTISRLLVKSPPGLGKTREAMDWATQYQTDREQRTKKFGPRRVGELMDLKGRFALFVPRHALATEIKSVIEDGYQKLGRSIEVPILRGRDHDADNGRAPCRRWQEARQLGRKGLPVYSNLCRRRRGAETVECPHFQDCEYIGSWRGASEARFVILVHAYLGLEWQSDSFVRLGDSFDIDGEQDDSQFFNPAQVQTIVCDEDPTQSLAEEQRFEKGALWSIKEHGLGELISQGLNTSVGLLSYLRGKGITPEQLRAAAETQRQEERRRGRVADPSEPDAASIAEAAPLIRLSRVLDRLADELASGREGLAYSLIAVGGERLIAQGRRRWPFQGRLLVLDGIASPQILGAFIPGLAVSDEIRVERNAFVVQVTDRTFYRGSLLKSAEAGEEGNRYDPNRWKEVCGFIEGIAQGSRTLVVTNKRVRCQLTDEDADAALPISAKFGNADVAHFGNIRGSNEFENHDTLIILGRNEPRVAAAEKSAMAIWYDTKEPIERISPSHNGRVNYPKKFRPYTIRDNSETVERVSVHPDPRVQAVVEQVREAEMLQAIDRLRLIHSERRKAVYILCNIPLDIPVDEFVTWKQLVGDQRLAAALTKCDARGWDALPLAPRELHRLFPGLWETEKAAKRWSEKKPPEATDSYIRLWGLLTEYRPVGQKSWSKSLIRHGVEDRALALGRVLEISPGSLRFKEDAAAGEQA
jgi:hypothetical protein